MSLICGNVNLYAFSGGMCFHFVIIQKHNGSHVLLHIQIYSVLNSYFLHLLKFRGTLYILRSKFFQIPQQQFVKISSGKIFSVTWTTTVFNPLHCEPLPVNK